MWFNSMQREEPYLGLTAYQTPVRCRVPLWLVYRWCMAVVSSCREMLG